MSPCEFDDTDILSKILSEADGNRDEAVREILNSLLYRYKNYFECINDSNLVNLIYDLIDLQELLSNAFDNFHMLSCFLSNNTRARFKPINRLEIKEEFRKTVSNDEKVKIEKQLLNICLETRLIFNFYILLNNTEKVDSKLLYNLLYNYLDSYETLDFIKNEIWKLVSTDILSNFCNNKLVDNFKYMRNNSFLAHGGFILNSGIDIDSFRKLVDSMLNDLEKTISGLKNTLGRL